MVADAIGDGEDPRDGPVMFKARRGTQVRDLLSHVADGQATFKSQKGKAERAAVREALRKDKSRLASTGSKRSRLEPPPVLGMREPGLACTRYYLQHRRFLRDGRPVPGLAAWAGHRRSPRGPFGKLARARRNRRRPRPSRSPCSPPGAPIEEVIAQLTAIQAGHPGAEVRQGPGHRLIWPAPQPTGTAGPVAGR